VLYFVPPGAISIADAVYWLASRKDDGRYYCWVSLYMAWQELRDRPTSKRGSKPKYDWPKIKAWAFELMDKRGEFDGRKWYQESLIRKLLERCSNEFGREPDRSTLIESYLPGWLEEWQERQRQQRQSEIDFQLFPTIPG
jgi:hypothetical protein